MSLRLDDETAYVTGASAGIGRAIAKQLHALGARVFLGARRTDRLEALQKELGGERVAIANVDVNDAASVDSWLAAGARFAPCSILVNNAGLALGRHKVEEADVTLWDRMLDTNARAVFAMTRKVLPGMIERGRGDVVFIASVAGAEPYGAGAGYCASKAAVQAFARSLRAEMLGRDIRVLCFDPGMVETEFSVVRFAGDVDAAKKVYAGMRPLSADDVADCVSFALTRPRHVSIDRMLILATDQLGTQAVHRL
jgi:3-hydroxy acid dehydrogenase/malonic semialdehyde reductase